MPPHHEPDAVLINTGGHGQPRMPEGNPPWGKTPTFYPDIFNIFHRIPYSFGIPGIPNYPSVPISPGQGTPFIPNTPNMYGGSRFPVGPRYFIPNVGTTIFTVAGSGNNPFPLPPDFFSPGKNPNNPERTDNFHPVRGMTPDVQRKDFQPEGLLPGGPYPEAPSIPNPQGWNFNGNFPRKEFHGGAGGREMYDDPIQPNFFPFTKLSPIIVAI